MFKNLSVKTTIIIALIAGVIIPALISSVLLSEKAKIESSHKIESYLEILSHEYAGAIWYVSDEWLESIDHSAFAFPTIANIKITLNDGKKVLHQASKEVGDRRVTTLQKKLYSNNQLLGELHLGLFEDEIQKSRQEHINSIVLIVFLQMGISIILLLPILYFKMTKQISKLTDDADSLKHGMLDMPFTWDGKDEFSIIGNAFEEARVSISSHINELTTSNERLIESLDQTKQLQNALEVSFMSLEERNEKIYTLLNNSEEGFLSFGSDLVVDGEYSIECERLFGENIAGGHIQKLLYPDEKYLQDKFSNMLKILFDADNADKVALYLELLPKEIKREDKFLSVRYRALDSGRLMMIVDDITQEKELQEKVEREQKRLHFVVNSLKNREDLTAAVEEFREFLEKLADLDSFEEAYRTIHTFKGTFAQYDFYHLPKALHECESTLSRLKAEGRSGDFMALLKARESILKEKLEYDLKTLDDVLGNGYFDKNIGIAVDEAELLKIESKVQSLIYDEDYHVELNEDTMEILNLFKTLRYKPFRELLDAYPMITLQLAQRLEKEIAPFLIEGGEFRVDPERFSPFTKSLLHVFRNACDHGIETPDERVEADKSEIARVSCRATLVDGQIVLEISDDGRGIDKEKIIAKADSLGLAVPENPLLLIFEDSFSTKEQVTELSGRGVGLSAVKAEIEKLGGRIEIETEVGVGSRLRFVMPL